ncbi:YbhB/YbcL family Raf kinase inhibitor-like protein [Helicobacter sp. 13S00477-4]|uniref:YbhB/YbcL family Raf kinase inhibitor-like protein n=1 Tax=Helicobacter sp. 13S00477-4 TaxID=1905759 RepID=UPI000BA52CB5|nr:YbhB/YbcL family Raf kinase inhibitor-like protein [Helicobacter sp. 13S00477-4]PAF52594.1 phospholipid-binding protein [Helicobacter sp. 13S00477-4]
MQFFEVTLDWDKNGFLDDKYGGNATAEFKDSNGYPDVSPKISWQEVSGAKSYALEFIDYDSVPVCGKVFVHWVVADIRKNILEENASRVDKGILQGINSITQGYLRSDLPEDKKFQSNLDTSKYIGPMPPNKDHHYLFTIYALDIPTLELKKPFFISDMHDKMRGHIIAIGRAEFKYRQYKR